MTEITDIKELAQREKFEAWAEHACAAPWGYLQKRRTAEGYSEQIYTCMWTAWKAADAELVEALEKAQQYGKERDQENQDLMLTIGRLRVDREDLRRRLDLERSISEHNELRTKRLEAQVEQLKAVTAAAIPPHKLGDMELAAQIADEYGSLREYVEMNNVMLALAQAVIAQQGDI